MLADAGPAFLGKAQGASLNSDEGRSILQSALTSRNDATNARITGDVNRALGPAEDPQTVTNAIRQYRSEVDAANYGRAVGPASGAPAVDTSNVLTELGQAINNSAGVERRALTTLRDMLMVPMPANSSRAGMVIPEANPAVLHKIKGELDSVIEYGAPGLGVPASALAQREGTLRRMRGILNEALERQVPGYAEANAASSALARRAEAVERGTQYLGNGKTTPSPDRFAGEFAQLEPGERIALAKGSRGNIDRVLGTKANDLQALRQELQGEGGWNTAKLATVHGPDAADELVAAVDRNLRFRDTFNKVVENSQTAQRQAAQAAMKPTPASEAPLLGPGTTGVGLVVGGGKRLLSAGYNAIRPDTTRPFGEVAQILTARGAERDKRLLDLIDALERRRGNQAVAEAFGNRGALLSAIAANGYARTYPKRNRER
jgi:hypothetical protein